MTTSLVRVSLVLCHTTDDPLTLPQDGCILTMLVESSSSPHMLKWSIQYFEHLGESGIILLSPEAVVQSVS